MMTDDRRDGAKDIARWGLAAVLAAVALVGLFSVVAAFVWALGPDLPGWVTTVLGAVLAVLAAAFAWVVATALRRRD